MDFWEAYDRIQELGKGSYGSAVLVRCKDGGRKLVVKEVDISRMNRKDARKAEQEAKVTFKSMLHTHGKVCVTAQDFSCTCPSMPQ